MVHLGFEPRLPDSKSDVLTDYTNGPRQGRLLHPILSYRAAFKLPRFKIFMTRFREASHKNRIHTPFTYTDSTAKFGYRQSSYSAAFA